MTTTTEKALLVIDMQQSLIADETPNPDEIIDAVAGLVEQARNARVPVIWVTDTRVAPHKSLHASFEPAPGEIQLEKGECNAFAGTSLGDMLSALSTQELVVCGMQSDACVRDTVTAAAQQGFAVTLAADAHTTYDWNGGDFRDIVDSVNSELAALPGVTLAPCAELTL